MDVRLCLQCQIERPYSDFYLNASGKPRTNRCKACWRERYYEPRRAEIISRNADLKRKREGRPGLRSLQCEHCGAMFEGTRKVARFCSRACKDIAHRAQVSADLHAAKPPRRCVWCGVDLAQAMRADAKFCSASCNSKAHQSVRCYRRRLGDAAVKPRREPLVSFIDIAERDGWRCGICGKAVNRRRVFPDPLAGSLDHLLPVAQGGSHEAANLQLAHFVCNWTKRDRAANDQLRLIG